MDHWGHNHQTEDENRLVMNLETILNNEASVNL
jgi:RNA binding exosome subunit